MKKSDLKYGNVIETNIGNRYICTINFENRYRMFLRLNEVNSYSVSFLNDENISEDLKKDLKVVKRETYIVKVYEDYTLKKVLWERPIKPTLTEDEKAILRNIDKNFKYIARNGKTGNLFVYKDAPLKGGSIWFKEGNIDLCAFNHLFKFIKWEDEEPYLIEDLLHA